MPGKFVNGVMTDETHIAEIDTGVKAATVQSSLACETLKRDTHERKENKFTHKGPTKSSKVIKK